MRNCACPPRLRAPSLSRTRPTSVHSFITRSSNQEERGEVPISEIVTYQLYVTRIPIFKAARSRSSSTISRVLCRFLSPGVYYLWRAARSSFSSWLWSMVRAHCFSGVYIWLGENYIRYMVWYRKPPSPEVPRRRDSRYYRSLTLSDLG